jgi:hypothetical protein
MMRELFSALLIGGSSQKASAQFPMPFVRLRALYQAMLQFTLNFMATVCFTIGQNTKKSLAARTPTHPTAIGA